MDLGLQHEFESEEAMSAPAEETSLSIVGQSLTIPLDL